MTKIAVLDDYVHFAEGAADWGSLEGAQVDFFYDTLLDHDALVKRLEPYDVLMTTCERTRFPREVLERLQAINEPRKEGWIFKEMPAEV